MSGQDPTTGRFVKGNTLGVGRSQPRYDRNITRDVKRVLAEYGDNGGESWSLRIVRAMARQAAAGNTKAAEWMADRAEGKAVQRLDVDVMNKARILAEMYGLDPGEVASMARQIAEDEAAAPLPPGPDSDFEGGSPGSRDSVVVDPPESSDPGE